jgi:2,4-dienoyl-CoA reductase-like NADH-dependent reductase (Old Yellow Enzyme family)
VKTFCKTKYTIIMLVYAEHKPVKAQFYAVTATLPSLACSDNSQRRQVASSMTKDDSKASFLQDHLRVAIDLCHRENCPVWVQICHCGCSRTPAYRFK